MKFESYFIDFIKLLNKNEVEYMLIGGMAVNVHGYSRSTGDMDIWMNSTIENGNKILKTIDEFGFDIEPIRDKDFTIADVIFVGGPPFRIDVLTKVQGVKFEDAWPKKINITVDDIIINVIGLEDLKAVKMLSGRHKDMDDLYNLNKIV